MAAVGKGAKPSVLVAVDEDVLFGLLEYKLSKSGFSVARASDGAATLEHLKSEEFDILLMDVMLQKLDGFTVLRELRSSGVTPPKATVVLSARGDEQDVLTAFQLGALDYVTKPFSLGILVERVRIAFESKAGAGQDGSRSTPVGQTARAVPKAEVHWNIEA